MLGLANNRTKSFVAAFIATGLNSGRVPHCPGTVGSLTGLLVWLVTARLGWWGSCSQALVLALLCLVAIAAIKAALPVVAENYPADQQQDPQMIVIDEWVGLFACLWGVQLNQWHWILTAFALFRLFDIIKPGPVAWAENLPGAWGIVADDLVAGILGTIIIHLLWYFCRC